LGSSTFPREDVPRQFAGDRGITGHVGRHGAGDGSDSHGGDVRSLQEGGGLCHEDLGSVLVGHQR